jgi:hypothetical protein
VRQLYWLAFAVVSTLAIGASAVPADAREVCRRVCDAYGECERRCVWVRDGERDRGRRNSQPNYDDEPPQRTPPPQRRVTQPPPPPPGGGQPPGSAGAGKQAGPRQPTGGPPGGGACVPSGFAKLSRNCSTNVGGCQRMPESCSRGWCCP